MCLKENLENHYPLDRKQIFDGTSVSVLKLLFYFFVILMSADSIDQLHNEIISTSII